MKCLEWPPELWTYGFWIDELSFSIEGLKGMSRGGRRKLR